MSPESTHSSKESDDIVVHPRGEVTWQAATIERYRKVAPATIGHFVEEGFLDPAIKPIGRRVKLVGPALTVYQPVHYSAMLTALEVAQPGDVLVIDRGGEHRRACFGEMMAWRLQRAGIAGIVIDGPATDCVEIEDMGLPVFSRGISALLGPVLARRGVVNGPITCGGVTIQAGDLILADDNGVVVISPARAHEMLERAEAQEAEEARRRAEYRRST